MLDRIRDRPCRGLVWLPACIRLFGGSGASEELGSARILAMGCHRALYEICFSDLIRRRDSIRDVPVVVIHETGVGRKEQRTTLVFVPWALVMCLVGLAFSYLVVFPMAFLFTEKVTFNLGLEQTYGVSQYFSFLFNILLPISLLFELPLVILFLSRIGILSPALLVRIRKIAWIILIAIGVTVTPPDVVSDLLVAVPLVLLYEISVFLSKLAFGRRQRALERETEAMDEA